MSIYLLITYVFTAFLLLSVGVVFLIHKPKSTLVHALCGVLVSAAGWLWAVRLVFSLVDHNSLVFAARAAFVFADFIPVFSFLFIFRYPETDRNKYERLVSLATFGWSAIVGIATMTTSLVVQDLRVMGEDRAWIYGAGYAVLFGAHFVVFSLGTLALLIAKLRHATVEQRTQLMVYAVGWLLAIIFGSFTNIILPNLGYHVSYLGPLASLFYILAIVYVLTRSGMIGVRVVGIETLVIAFACFQTLGFVLATSNLNMILAAISVLLSVGTGAIILIGLQRERVQKDNLVALTQRLEESNAHLLKLDELKSEFISIASHQLRTPISIIKGYLSLARQGAYGEMPTALREKVGQITEMNDRLGRLISNLLNLTRLEKGRVEYFCVSTRVTPLILQVVDEMYGSVRSRGVELSFHDASVPLPPAWIDPDKLRETLANLIDNAAKFSSGGKVVITADYSPDKQVVVIHVTDNGAGMREEDARHVFEKYFRASDSDHLHQNGSGMGLGLYICAKFMRGMGGDIMIERTAPKEGTTIALYLPIDPSGECEKPGAPTTDNKPR